MPLEKYKMITQNFLALIFPVVKKSTIIANLEKRITSDLKLLKNEAIIGKAKIRCFIWVRKSAEGDQE